MTKCLVTKLNGIVENDSLRRLGEFKARVGLHTGDTSCTVFFKPQAGKTVTVRTSVPTEIVCTGHDKVTATEFECDNYTYVNSKQEFTISITQKYNLEKLEFKAWPESSQTEVLECDPFNYIPMTDFVVVRNNTKGNIVDLDSVTAKLNTIQVQQSFNIYGTFKNADLSDLTSIVATGSGLKAIDVSKCSKLKVCNLAWSHIETDITTIPSGVTQLNIDENSALTGNIGNLKCDNITNVAINGSHTITGEVNDLATARKNRGVTTDFQVIMNNTCTFNGETKGLHSDKTKVVFTYTDGNFVGEWQ